MKLNRLLLTGATGGVGTAIRGSLAQFANIVRVSDFVDLGDAAPHEELMQADIRKRAEVEKIVADCDAIVHLGGISIEGNAELIHDTNIKGTYHLYDCARLAGVKRILFASSVHAIGFHNRETLLDADSLTRPDSVYGVSKVYGEALARLYYDKFGIETLVVRIGSIFPKPVDRRMMATWMSHQDMTRLIARMLEAPRLGCPIVYGVSDNPETWWDNRKTRYLGWSPKDSSAQFAGLYDDLPPEDPNDPIQQYQGGKFAKAGHFDD